MKKKVLISVGGTGGHVIPATALADKLIHEGMECLFVGAGLSKNPYFARSHYQYEDIQSAPISLRGCLKILTGVKESRKIMEKFRPDVVVGFGSYHTVPTLAAAVLRADPVVLYEANTVPGRALRLFSSFAKVTCVHFAQAMNRLRGATLQVKYPLRKEYQSKDVAREVCYQYFGLEPGLTTLLIFGGSQGARGINALMRESIAGLKAKCPPFQVIHITGSLEAKDEFEVLYKRLGIVACVREFEPKIDLAWRIATLCITRAGAGSIAEQLEMEVPGILIPFPGSKDRHQEINADLMMWTVGGGIKLLESKATPNILVDKVLHLMDLATQSKMKRAIQVYKHNTECAELVEVIRGIG